MANDGLAVGSSTRTYIFNVGGDIECTEHALTGHMRGSVLACRIASGSPWTNAEWDRDPSRSRTSALWRECLILDRRHSRSDPDLVRVWSARECETITTTAHLFEGSKT